MSIAFKGSSGTKYFYSYILLLLFQLLFHLYHLLLKKLLVALMMQLKLLTKHQEIRLLVFFVSFFTDSVTPSVNTLKFSNDFMILVILFISSFEINKVNLFPALIVFFFTYFSLKFVYCI